MGHGPVKIDPAIERFNTMRESAYITFRWTRKTVRTAILGFVIAPAAIYYTASAFNQRWDFSGKRKGENLLTPKAQAASEQ